MRLALLLILFTVLAGCRDRTDVDLNLLSDQAERVIRETTVGVPMTVVDLDAIEAETLVPDLVIGTNDEITDDQIVLGRSGGMTTVDDSLYVVDRQQKLVLVAHKDSAKYSRSLGRPGEGPGEFRRPHDIMASAKYYFVADHGARRSHVFDRQFEYVSDIPGTAGACEQDVAQSNLVTCPAGSSGDRLLLLRAPTPPFAVSDSLLPRLTDIDDRASSYNIATARINTSGRILAAYAGIPLLMVYDDRLKLDHVLRLKGDGIPDDDPYESSSEFGFRIPVVISAIEFTDEGNIIVAHRNHLFVLQPLDSTWRIARRIHLQERTTSNAPVIVRSMEMDGEHIVYASAIGDTRIFRFRLDDTED